MSTYIRYQSRYMSSLTGYILTMSFLAPSTGIRFSKYLLTSACVMLTVLVTIVFGWKFGYGVDGQSLRMLLMAALINVSSVFVLRLSEREMRRYFEMRVTYKL